MHNPAPQTSPGHRGRVPLPGPHYSPAPQGDWKDTKHPSKAVLCRVNWGCTGDVLETLTLLALVFRFPWILGATLPLVLSEAARLCSFLRDEMQQRAARIETLPGSCVPNTVPGLDTRQVRAELPSTVPPPPHSRERFLKARGEGPPG